MELSIQQISNDYTYHSAARMPKALSEDLRWRIMWQCCYRGEQAEQVARSLYVSVKTVQRIANLFNRTGSVFPAVQSHGPAKKLSESEELTVL